MGSVQQASGTVTPRTSRSQLALVRAGELYARRALMSFSRIPGSDSPERGSSSVGTVGAKTYQPWDA